MQRRDVLTSTAAVAGVIGLAGCSAISSGGDGGDSGNGGDKTSMDDRVTVVNHDMSYSGGGDDGPLFAYVTGELFNVTDEEIESLVVSVDFYDESGEVIRTAADAVVGLPANERFEFSVQFPSPSDQPRLAASVDSYKISLYKSAENVRVEIPDVEDGGVPDTDPSTGGGEA
jgi:hypothetical protein